MEPTKAPGTGPSKPDPPQSALSRLVGDRPPNQVASGSDSPLPIGQRRQLPKPASLQASPKMSPTQSPDASPFNARRNYRLPEPSPPQPYALMSSSVRKQRGDERDSVEGVQVLYDPVSGGNIVVYDPLLNKGPHSGDSSPESRGSPAGPQIRRPTSSIPSPLARSTTAPTIISKPPASTSAPNPSPFGDPHAPTPSLLGDGVLPSPTTSVPGARIRGNSIFENPDLPLRTELDSSKTIPQALAADEAQASPLPTLSQSLGSVPSLGAVERNRQYTIGTSSAPNDPLLNPEKSPRSPRPNRLPSSSIPAPLQRQASIPLPSALPPPPDIAATPPSPHRSPRPRSNAPLPPMTGVPTGASGRPPSLTLGATPPPPPVALAKSRPPSATLGAASLMLPPPPLVAGTVKAPPPGVAKKPTEPAVDPPASVGGSSASTKVSGGSRPTTTTSSGGAPDAAKPTEQSSLPVPTGAQANRPASIVLPPLPPPTASASSTVPPSPRLSEDYLIAGALRPERKGPLFEHFLVVGLPLNAKLPRIPAKYEPQILYKWPSDVKLRVGQIEQFCFPVGVEVSTVRRTPSMSSLNEIMFASSNITHASNSFSFLLTGEGTFLYGVCVVRDELLGEAATFFDGPSVQLPFQRSYVVAPKCYCLLTRFPYFRLHFDILHNILAHERMQKMQREMFESAPENLRRSMSNFNEVVPLMRAAAQLNSPHPVWEGVAPDQTQSLEEVRDPQSMFASIERILTLSPRGGRATLQASGGPNSEDLSQHPVRKLLTAYYATPMPLPGATLVMQMPVGVPELQPFSPFTCPLEDETASLLGEWAVTSLCRVMSIENILLMMSAVLQEKQVIIVSKTLGSLSYVALSVIPLLRPFVWQGLFIPILPQLLIDYVEAPVPYIAGLLRAPDNLREDLVVVHLDQNKVSSGGPIEKLPEFSKLSNNLRTHHAKLFKPNVQLNPYHTLPSEQSAATEFAKAFNSYLTWLASKMVDHYKKWNLEVADLDEVKQSFLKAVSANNRKFMETLLNTQHFHVYIEQVLRKEKEELQQQRFAKK